MLLDTYVDDGTTGRTTTEIQRMLGQKLPDKSFDGTISSMMAKVGLKLKTIVSSVSCDQESIEKLSEKVLGCLWDPMKDLIGIKFSFNPSKRKKGVKVMPNLTIKDLN